MRATDVMTSEVITVGEDASVQEAAKLMANNGISALPVVDRGKRVVGMVSEGDLLHRAETGTERRRSWWLEMAASTNRLAGEYVKSHSGKVNDVMTRDVISVIEETQVADIAILLETNRIKRVAVLRDGRLVGIVSRANLVRALAMTINEATSGAEADDAIQYLDRITTINPNTPFFVYYVPGAVHAPQKWAEVSPANITVKEGVVHLWSSYYSEEEKLALIVAAENIPGVRRVEDHMRPVAAYLV
ncbi:MAG: CBS domain-containing protein [Alphaproteobacteria bacterium]|nr:CBS domain-containing protein [Alphaproteobacteria bacterium]